MSRSRGRVEECPLIASAAAVIRNAEARQSQRSTIIGEKCRSARAPKIRGEISEAVAMVAKTKGHKEV
jgi:hypothetical protein